jgi:hypothetical protein
MRSLREKLTTEVMICFQAPFRSFEDWNLKSSDGRRVSAIRLSIPCLDENDSASVWIDSAVDVRLREIRRCKDWTGPGDVPISDGEESR